MNLIYSRGFPYGAPLVMLRGGATKDAAVKDALRAAGFRWDGTTYAWTMYLDRLDLGALLVRMRDEFGCEVKPKDGMDRNYLLDLDAPGYARP